MIRETLKIREPVQGPHRKEQLKPVEIWKLKKWPIKMKVKNWSLEKKKILKKKLDINVAIGESKAE